MGEWNLSFETKALITDEGRRRTAEMWTTGKAFVITGFYLGNAGHDPLDPTTALAPDPAVTECPAVVFGPKATAGFTYANDYCPVWECIVEFGEGVTLFSSVCLLAQIVYSPVPADPELNSTFLFAVANFPQRPKLDTEQLIIRIGAQR
jgi:hypothetical protein